MGFYIVTTKAPDMDDDEQLDWLTEMDEEILEILSTGLTLGPTAIAQNIDRSREGVSNRLNSLQAGGLVEKVDRGKYRLADYEGTYLTEIEVSDEERDEIALREHQLREDVKQDLGVTLEKYQELVSKEEQRIQKEQPECDNPLDRAFKIVEQRLREENEDTSTDK